MKRGNKLVIICAVFIIGFLFALVIIVDSLHTPCSLTVSVEGEGTIEIEKRASMINRVVWSTTSTETYEVKKGDRLILIPHSDKGWKFNSWDGDIRGNAKILVIEYVHGDINITAYFVFVG